MTRKYGAPFILFLLYLVTFAGCASHPGPSVLPQQSPMLVLSDLDQGLKLIEERDYAGGKAKLETALESQSSNAEAWFALGRVYLHYYKDFEKAIEAGNAAVEYDPDNPDYHQMLGEAYGMLAQKSGRNMKALNLALKARSEFMKAVELNQDHLWARRSLMEYLAQAPRIAGGSWDEAKEMAEETLSIDAASAYVMLASLHRKKDQTDKAEEAYLMAVEADPRNSSARIEAGWFYFDERRYDEARIHLEKYQELNPQDPHSSSNLGWFLALSSDFAEAEVQLKKAIALQPRYVEAWYRLGELYRRKGEVEKAQNALQTCTALDSDNRWTGTREEGKAKKERRKKHENASLKEYTVVGVLQSQQKRHKGKSHTAYLVEGTNGILFSLPAYGMEAEEYVGKNVKVVGEVVEKTDKKGVDRLIFKKISSFEVVE